MQTATTAERIRESFDRFLLMAPVITEQLTVQYCIFFTLQRKRKKKNDEQIIAYRLAYQVGHE